MKKFALLLVMALFSLTAFSQKIVNTPSNSAKFKKICTAGDLIVNTGTRAMYLVLDGKTVGTQDNVTIGLAGTPRIAQLVATTGGQYVDTTNAQSVRGIKTFYSPPATSMGSGGSASSNCGYGLSALNAMTTGANNLGIGQSSLAHNTTGNANTAVGWGALGTTVSTTGSTAVGYASLAVSTGAQNTAVGNSSLNYNTTGRDNVAIGFNANAYKTTGSYNVSLGSYALLNNATGASNIAIGYSAGYNETGSSKLIISNIAGGSDTAIIYGTMGATPSASTLQLNAAVKIPITLEGGSLMRGNASFTTTATRVAVYVPGITNASYVFVQPNAPSGTTLPVAGDFCNVFVKNDSIIVMRQAGTTSGLSFDWFRIK